MIKSVFSGVSLAALVGLSPMAIAQVDDDANPALQDVVIVTAQRSSPTEGHIHPDNLPLEGPDVTRLLARTPGGARIANGELSGQVQYRGLFGERLNLRVDGQRFASGGPNLMDPVFHYAPASLIKKVIIDRGVSPVSEGPGLAGGADAVFKRVDFADSAEMDFGYDLTIGARSVDNSIAAGGVVGVATDTWRFNLLASYEDGDDYDYPEGTVGGSLFNRAVYGFSTGVRLGDHTFTLDARRQNTGDSGNPPFPMDIRYFDTDFVSVGYLGDFEAFDVEANVGYIDVAHAMNNYDLRPDIADAKLREALATAETLSGDLAVSLFYLGGELKVGLDGEQVEHNVLIINPTNDNFYLNSLPDIEEQRIGVFAEWTGATPHGFNTQLGLRVDDYASEAGIAEIGPALPSGPQMLASMFNMRDNSTDETTFDAVARFWTDEHNGLSWRGTLARKTRVPNYLQYYGWMPLNASGGLADGNIYVGDINLKPETAYIVEGGFDYASTGFYARPTIYYRQVDDYIQGVPYDDTIGVIDTPVEMIANMGGDPTPLRFANVDAKLYGLDLDFGYDLPGDWRLDGVFSYVRGERRDIDDNLYRVAPPNLTLAATYERPSWSASFEVRGVATQEEVSATNSEEETPGYALFNLYGDWMINEGVHVHFGIENLFDHTYRDHLSGYNRNGLSDVTVGTRVPGAGRSAFIRIGFVG